jgi:hypothetical protein
MFRDAIKPGQLSGSAAATGVVRMRHKDAAIRTGTRPKVSMDASKALSL